MSPAVVGWFDVVGFESLERFVVGGEGLEFFGEMGEGGGFGGEGEL